jgi:hypothetical protein
MDNTVWSVNILLGIGLIGVAYVIYYVLTLDNNESTTDRSSHSDEIDN